MRCGYTDKDRQCTRMRGHKGIGPTSHTLGEPGDIDQDAIDAGPQLRNPGPFPISEVPESETIAPESEPEEDRDRGITNGLFSKLGG